MHLCPFSGLEAPLILLVAQLPKHGLLLGQFRICLKRIISFSQGCGYGYVLAGAEGNSTGYETSGCLYLL